VNPDSLVRQAMNSFTKSWGPFVRGIVAREVMPTWERMWMTSSRRRLGLQPRLLDNGSNNNNRLVRVRGILLFGQRARRRPAVGVSRVPSLGPNHRGVEERATVVRAVVRGEI
jgi:hypothetical protein